MAKKILVTGGAGYIGSHTVYELIQAGYEPIILDDFSNSSENAYEHFVKLLGKEPEFYNGNAADFGLLCTIFEVHNIEAVIHFAAFKAVGESVELPLKYYQNNLFSCITLLEVMRIYNVGKIIFSSSCTVYGSPENGFEVNENTPQQIAASPYGATKQMCERIITDTCNAHEMQAVILRYFNPVGAHESGMIGELPVGIPNNLLPFITQTACGLRESVAVFGNDYNTKDGTCERDFIHVSDLAEAHVKAISYHFEENSTFFNIGTGKATSVLELIAAFETENELKVNWNFAPRRPGDIEAIFANVDKATNLLDWKAKRTIFDAVRDAWRWEKYREEHEIH